MKKISLGLLVLVSLLGIDKGNAARSDVNEYSKLPIDTSIPDAKPVGIFWADSGKDIGSKNAPGSAIATFQVRATTPYGQFMERLALNASTGALHAFTSGGKLITEKNWKTVARSEVLRDGKVYISKK